MTATQNLAMSRRGFCLCCAGGATFAATGGWLTPRQAFAEARGANLRELNLCREIFAGQAEDGEHVDLALFQLLPAEFYRVRAAGNCITQRAFAFAKIVIISESVFYIFKCT